MLKKLLTTIIVLAATATAWADGWVVDNSATSGGNGAADGMSNYGISVIKWSESVTSDLAAAIDEANNSGTYMIRISGNITGQDAALSGIKKEKVDLSGVIGMTKFNVFAENTVVKYVILPDNTSKENVDALGKTVDAAASKKDHTAIVWRYDTYDATGIEYTGVRYNETVVGGIAQATGKVSETVALSIPTTLYYGKVFYDKSGNAFKTSDDSKSVQLTSYTKRYTYVDENGATRLYPNSNGYNGYYVVSENGGYVGVQTSSTVTVEKQNVEYTYEKNNETYVYTFNGYNPIGKKREQLYMVEGAQAYDIQKETKWIIESTSEVYNEDNGRLVTNNNINIGHVGGTQIPLTKVSAYYYADNIYEGPIRIGGEKVYGRDGGTPVELSLVYYYEDWNDNNTVKPADKETFYVNYNGTKVATGNGFFEVTLNASGEYVDVNGKVQHGANETNVYKKLSGDGKMYMNWSNPAIYVVTSFGYEYSDGTTCTEVYTKDGKYYGYTDGKEIELENRISYTTEGGETYEGDVYTYNNEYFGYDGGESVNLKEETSEYYYPGGWIHESNKKIITENDYKSEDGKKVYVGGTQTPLTPYNKEAYVITASNVSGYSQNTIFTGRVYKETYGLIGLIGGTDTSVTYSATGYYYNKDNKDYVYTGEYLTKPANEYNTTIYGCTDNNVLEPLKAVYQYTYTDPITGETVVYETMEQESSVTVQHDVTVTAKKEEAGNIHLTAYVSAPGSLLYVLARWADLGSDNSGYGALQVGNVTALTLSGDVNFTDIGNGGNEVSEYGHVKYWDSLNKQYAIPNEKGHDNTVENANCAMSGNALTYIDLTDAVFDIQTDMQFKNVNSKLETVILPTNEHMTLIPDDAFNNMPNISELCIPYNYEIIGSGAFYLCTKLYHIYTTDPNPAVIVDNGPGTFTFSANLKEIEGADVASSGTLATFNGIAVETISDIYVLAKDAPLCGAGAFDSSMTYGDNGFAGDIAHPIGRHNYQNHKKIFVMLHYPSECTDEQAMNYTDITRQYTLADETGEVDGKGRPRMWPKHVEFGAAYNNALKGVIWDQTTGYDTRYQGWHEIVLVGNSLARDYDPQSENTQFVYRDWVTVCVPYDLKKSQVLSLLGVDPSVSVGHKDQVVKPVLDADGNPVLDTEGNPTFDVISETEVPLYPDVRALTHVSRSVDNRKMTLHFAKLIEKNQNEETGVLEDRFYDVSINETHGQGFTREELTGDDDPVVMEGGHPYLIRAYVPAAWDAKIKNIGYYIMSAASSANHAKEEMGVSAENLPYQYGKCTVTSGDVELYLPCLKHKVHAFDADDNRSIVEVEPGERNGDFSYTDAGKENPILYHFIGTYTSTKIPQYGYYIGKAKDGSHKFSRTTRTGDAAYTWAPYTAVIVGLSEPTYDTDAFGNTASGSTSTESSAISVDGSIDNIVVNPGVDGDDLKIYVGEDAELGASGARLNVGGFEDSTATGIVDVNMNENVNVNVSDNKVYNINGQYMGTSLNRLPKGIYIINGQKKVVK